MSRKYLRTCGFTLIELLVVVAIIAVLIAMLLPSLTQARSAAKMLACSASLKGVHMGTALYAEDNADLVPWCGWEGVASHFKNGDGTYTSFGLLAKHKYLVGRDVVHCAGDSESAVVQGDLSLIPNSWGWQASYGYMCEVAWQAHPMGAVTSGTTWPERKLSKSHPRAALFLDDTGGGSNIAKENHGRGVNVAYVEGYVKVVPKQLYFGIGNYSWHLFDDNLTMGVDWSYDNPAHNF